MTRAMRIRLRKGVIPLLFLAAAGCGRKEAQAPQKRIPKVQVSAVGRTTVQFSRSYLVSLDPFRETRIMSKASGYVVEILADKGDFVLAGRKLAVVEGEELGEQARQAEAQVSAVAVSLENARRYAGRVEKLSEQHLVSEAEADNAKAALELAEAQHESAQAALALIRTRTSFTEIFAPFNGYIVEREAELGTLVGPQGPALFTLGSVSRIKARASVPQADLRFFSAGTPVTLALDGFEAAPVKGAVKRFAPSLDRQTRTIEMEMEFDNPDGTLKPGMFGRVSVALGDPEKLVVLDPRAIARKQDSGFAFVVENGKAREVKLDLGRLLPDGRVEVISGLAEGMQVIVAGRDLVRDGMEVKTVSERSAELK